MAVVNLKQELWAATIVTLLEKTSTIVGVSNRDIIETDGADTYRIVGIGEVTTQDTPAVGTAITYSQVTDTNQSFTHNVDKTFGIIIPDRDVLESMEGWEALYSQRGGYQLRNEFDAAALGDFINWSSTTGVPTTVGADASGIPDFFSSLAENMDSADLPGGGRYIIVNPSMVQALRIWFADKGTDIGDDVSVNGAVANVFGIDVFMSRNLTNLTGIDQGLAGVKGQGIAINVLTPDLIETLRDKDGWENYVRGRLIAGYKTYQSDRVFRVAHGDNVLQ